MATGTPLEASKDVGLKIIVKIFYASLQKRRTKLQFIENGL